jgi:hypothetical protein
MAFCADHQQVCIKAHCGINQHCRWSSFHDVQLYILSYPLHEALRLREVIMKAFTYGPNGVETVDIYINAPGIIRVENCDKVNVCNSPRHPTDELVEGCIAIV